MAAFFRGFKYAAKGVAQALCEERNLRFHICVAIYVVIFSFFYGLSAAQYALLSAVIAGVLALELLNSALERAVDLACPGESKLAGAAKNMAAGAVLVFALGAVVCGVLLFWDLDVFQKIINYFAQNPWLLLPLAASLALCGWFVFGFGRRAPRRVKEPTDEQHGE